VSVLFSYAFRPLFLLTTIYAVLVVPYWTAAWLGYLPMPMWLGMPSWWHAHEMLYGFAGGAIGGFALTAVATWTSRPPVAGFGLMVLSALWLLARLLFALPFSILHGAAMLSDLAYGTMLFALMSREVIRARSRRNYKVLVILGLLPIANALFFFGVNEGATWSGTALMASLWLVVLLVALIAGRIVPAFTRNWLKAHGRSGQGDEEALPPAFDRFDLVTTYFMVGFAILQLSNGSSSWVALYGVVTGVLFALRLARWKGFRTLDEPLVWVLHLGFAWLPIGFVLLGLAGAGLVPRSAGIHALTSGAIATMIVAVAGRAALGHTSRPLRSHPMLTAAYGLITISAVCRIIATFADPVWLMGSATAWCLGFTSFAWRYIPILTQPAPTRSRALPLV
jgi:uncharacterized protein involved in response to NO